MIMGMMFVSSHHWMISGKARICIEVLHYWCFLRWWMMLWSWTLLSSSLGRFWTFGYFLNVDILFYFLRRKVLFSLMHVKSDQIQSPTSNLSCWHLHYTHFFELESPLKQNLLLKNQYLIMYGMVFAVPLLYWQLLRKPVSNVFET